MLREIENQIQDKIENFQDGAKKIGDKYVRHSLKFLKLDASGSKGQVGVDIK